MSLRRFKTAITPASTHAPASLSATLSRHCARHLCHRLHPHLSSSSQLHLRRAICMFEETCGHSSSCYVRICHCVLLITIKNYAQYQLYVFLSSLQIGIVNRNRNMEHAVTVNCATRRYFHLLVLLVLLAATCQVAQVGVILSGKSIARGALSGTWRY